MPLFAFLSGLVFSSLSEARTVGKKFLKQSYRLLVPFLIMGLIYAFTIRKGESFLQQPYKLGLWYLFFLWQCYFITHLYNIVLLPFAQKNVYLTLVMDVFWIVLVYGIVKLITILCTVELNKLVGSIHIIRLYPFFFIGCVLKRLNFTPPNWKKGDLIASVSSIIWLLLIWNINISPSSYPLIMVFCIGFLALYPISFWFAKLSAQISNKVSGALVLFGKYSLEIYMFHRFMTSTCNLNRLGEFIQGSDNYTIEVLIVLFLSLIMSYSCVYITKILSINNIIAFLLLGKMKKR